MTIRILTTLLALCLVWGCSFDDTFFPVYQRPDHKTDTNQENIVLKSADGMNIHHFLIKSQSNPKATIFVMSKYLPDYRGVFNAGDDPDFTATITAGFNIEFKHTLQALRPGHCHMVLSRGLVLCPFWCFGLFTFTASCRCHPCPILAVGGESALGCYEG